VNHCIDCSVEEFFHTLQMRKAEKYPSNCNTNEDIDEKTNPFFALPAAPIKTVKYFPYCFQNYLKKPNPLILEVYELPSTACL
jgi:hypothetical protein